MTDVKISQPNRVKSFPYGEGALWLAFAWLALMAVWEERFEADVITLAAVFALAAIGVRATRPAKKHQ